MKRDLHTTAMRETPRRIGLHSGPVVDVISYVSGMGSGLSKTNATRRAWNLSRDVAPGSTRLYGIQEMRSRRRHRRRRRHRVSDRYASRLKLSYESKNKVVSRVVSYRVRGM